MTIPFSVGTQTQRQPFVDAASQTDFSQQAASPSKSRLRKEARNFSRTLITSGGAFMLTGTYFFIRNTFSTESIFLTNCDKNPESCFLKKYQAAVIATGVTMVSTGILMKKIYRYLKITPRNADIRRPESTAHEIELPQHYSPQSDSTPSESVQLLVDNSNNV